MRRLPPGLDDDPAFPRQNHLALASFLVGCFTLFGQILGVCAFYCSAPALMIPTLLGLLMGAFAWRQAKLTGVGRDLAAAGLILGLINLGISTFWVALLMLYAVAAGGIYLLTL